MVKIILILFPHQLRTVIMTVSILLFLLHVLPGPFFCLIVINTLGEEPAWESQQILGNVIKQMF